MKHPKYYAAVWRVDSEEGWAGLRREIVSKFMKEWPPGARLLRIGAGETADEAAGIDSVEDLASTILERVEALK